MPSTSHSSTTSNDQCEHCHTPYTVIKRKKSCAVCRQYYCTTCAPRERHYNQPYRICLICQLISSDSTTDEQLLALKVKHLRCFLQAKNIANHTCTEKQELVDLIVRNRHAPFTRLLIQQAQTSPPPPPPPPPPPTTTTNLNQQQFHTTFNQFSTSTSASSSSSSSSSSTTTTAMPPPPPPPPPKHGNFTNFQHTMSSFASQMNHFAANLQDYVTNTVSGVLHHALGDHQQTTTTTTTTNNGNGTSSTFNFGTTTNGPFTYSFSSPGNFVYTTTTSNGTTASPQQQRRTTTTTTTSETTASSNTQQQTSTSQRSRRKSLSELNNEQNIEDLTVRELKEILVANFVDYKGCVEKNELIEKVRRLYRDRQNEKIKAKELDSATASDSELCKVCMDAIADCVFLDCGHMVTCVKCGKLLAECPICRSNIVRVVRVFKS
jgi:hypothetical protein